MIYIEKRKVFASMCDNKAKLSIIAVFQIVEDAITNCMEKLKIDGITTLKKFNAMWVFTKNKISFLNDAMWNDELEVKSFISAKSLAKIELNTAIFCQGKMIACAKSEACAVDKITGTIRKTNTVGIDESIEVENPICNLAFSHEVIPFEFFTKISSCTVKFTNLDYLSHTNNVEYIRMILDTFSADELAKHQIKEFEIDYKKQSFENDKLDILTYQTNELTYFKLISNQNVIVSGCINR